MPTVSVIIPNYNHAPYLRERIESVLNQTYRDFEVIILDDCSTDNSREIIESYRKHEKITYIEYNPVNSGSTFKQWKKGLERAQGEWIWIAESDDVADNNFLKTLIHAAEKTSVLVFCKSEIIDNQGSHALFLGEHVFPNTTYWERFTDKNQVFTGDKLVTENMYRFNQIVNASSVIFKKEFAPFQDETFNTFKLCGDWYFWISLLKKGDAVYISNLLNKFRTHSKTVRDTTNLQIFTYFENASIIHKILNEFHVTKKQKKIYLDYLIYIFYNRYDKSSRKKYLKEFFNSLNPWGIKGKFSAIKYQFTHA